MENVQIKQDEEISNVTKKVDIDKAFLEGEDIEIKKYLIMIKMQL